MTQPGGARPTGAGTLADDVHDTHAADPTGMNVTRPCPEGEDAPEGDERWRGPRAKDRERGALIGRFVVLARLGAGAMGVVYEVYDPELDRNIALKVIAPHVAEAKGSASAQARLLREAQALGRLSHPNVVAVHDVGEHDGSVWIAMELVRGQTLRAWLSAERRHWSAIVDVMLRAGHGLAAAHSAGLLHRDFKPDNVMVALDGRVRVMDFGLARARAREDATDASDSTGDGLSASVGARARDDRGHDLTLAGAMLGTPGYMSPEQFGAGAVGPASDQYAFCVTLYEALYGQRPVEARTVAELVVKVLDGELRPWPRGGTVPAWLKSVCQRGLSTRAEDRFPSLAALLDDLARGRGRAARRRVYAIALCGAAIVAAIVGYRQIDHQVRVAQCAAEGAKVRALWSPEIGDRVHHGLRASHVAYAPSVADKLMPWLDRHAEQWRQASIEVCTHASIATDWDRDLIDRARWCLDDRAMEFSALIDQFEHATTETVTQAVSAAAALRPPSRCAEPQALARLPLPSPSKRERLGALRVNLANAAALEVAGRYDEARIATQAVLEGLEGVAWPPLVAAARVRLGSVLTELGELPAAETELETGYFTAASSGAPEVALDAANQLVYVVGNRQMRHAEGLRWAEHAKVLWSSLSVSEELWRAKTLTNLATVHRRRGAPDEAITLHEQAIAILERELGPDHPDLARSLVNLANVYLDAARYDEAITLIDRGRATYERALGPDHPTVGTCLNNLGIVLHGLGRDTDAIAALERALAIRQAALGAEHPLVGDTLSNLGGVYYLTEDLDRAAPAFERALHIARLHGGQADGSAALAMTSLGSVRQDLGQIEEAIALFEEASALYERGGTAYEVGRSMTLFNLASARSQQGKWPDAKALHEQALALRQAHLDPSHPDIASSHEGLAEVALAAGDSETAAKHYATALAARTSSQGEDHPDLFASLRGLAEVALMRRRCAEALDVRPKLEKIHAASALPPRRDADVAFALARIASVCAEDPHQASALARSALAQLRASRPQPTQQIADVERFLTGLPPQPGDAPK